MLSGRQAIRQLLVSGELVADASGIGARDLAGDDSFVPRAARLSHA